MGYYYIITFGCQLNESDSEKIAGILESMEYKEAPSLEQTDILIINTCAVRQKAEEKVFSLIGRIKKLKDNNPNMIIGVCGCIPQQKGVAHKIAKRFNYVNIIFGTFTIPHFPELLLEARKSNNTIIDVEEKYQLLENEPLKRKDFIKAWVPIIYGCNNFCSYCIVPYVRGKERSRLPEDIINEVSKLVEEGYKEITLLGQNVNFYGKDLSINIDFSDLLRRVNFIDRLKRIRFMTSHPRDFKFNLIKTIKESPRICEHFHLPVQAGSNRILKSMNRGYSCEQYIELVNQIRQEIPDASITTDIIVGFPGETGKDFNDTLKLLEEIRFDAAFTFVYSPRKGTPAAKMPNHVTHEIKKERIIELNKLQNKITQEKNELLLGNVVRILVEGVSKTNKQLLTGRTRTNKLVHFKGNENLIGNICEVIIEEANAWSLKGKCINTVNKA